MPLECTASGVKTLHEKQQSFETENVTENRLLAIIDLIKKDRAISTESLATTLKITRRTVARDIEKLKENGVLIRIGHDKGGYWKIIKEKKH